MIYTVLILVYLLIGTLYWATFGCEDAGDLLVCVVLSTIWPGVVFVRFLRRIA